MEKKVSNRTINGLSYLSLVVGMGGFISFGYIRAFALIPLTAGLIIGLIEHRLTMKYGTTAMQLQMRPGIIISLFGLVVVAGFWFLTSIDLNQI
ncbi:hypothetical protein [Isachenkonia alkalipeptolytica]|uniref:Uncharacterized protein n=1 Tax=Isachenkonia alkalipeptolytica TaxID=2565777 RepID=A0AA44BGY2_9CLOT|nr:hypothetical protein [Isachenkonia alkalipeptolytica]NBG89696.1 hypothetical protein [Isachenkonia alkalipeptolytica]